MINNEQNKAYEFAIKLLSMREYAQSDLKNRLVQKGYSDSVAQAILQTLSAQNLQSDVRFVESYVRMRKRRGYSIRRIRLELEQRGIDQHLMLPLLEKAQEGWQQHILEVWQKKFKCQKPALLAEKARQMRFLQYRGFTIEQIQWVWQCGNE